MRSLTRFWPAVSILVIGALIFSWLGVGNSSPDAALARPIRPNDCRLDPDRAAVKHVIYVQFDNTHFLRDNPNVPSDLEQMPHLLDFIRNNGTLMTNDHTILISHTGGGILSSLTGLNPDQGGWTVSNSYVRYNGAGFQFPSTFGYWTDPASATTSAFNMITPDGKNVPAPFVAYTRAGCDVGAVAAANIVLENTGTGMSGDITKVFGSGSPQFIEAQQSAAAPAGTAARNKAQTDFVGFAVHCGLSSTICANGHDDLLPDEPGGYAGYKGLFGAQEVNPFLTGQPATVALNDLAGQPIVDPFGQPGFPGFDGMFAGTSLAYVAAMQEKGVTVTYGYISDAHDNHGNAGNAHFAYGPGEAGYVQQLKSYDDAFAAFFTRLASSGINKDNTLFVFTVDEGDHFVGSAPTNGGPPPVLTPTITRTRTVTPTTAVCVSSFVRRCDATATPTVTTPPTQTPTATATLAAGGCDGIHIPCTFSLIGEVNVNIDLVMQEQHPELNPSNTTFTVHGDDAPTVYLSGNPSQTSATARAYERAFASLHVPNPYNNNQDTPMMEQIADRTGMRLLHMGPTGDPGREPTFVYFADPTFFITDFPQSTCKTCVPTSGNTFAWNHGDIQQEIATTWVGFVGPGVKHLGENSTWMDHTDVRPTMLTLMGLSDSYYHDGRVVVDILQDAALAAPVLQQLTTVKSVGEIYKKINAPFGQLAMESLPISTAALVSNAAGDTRYTSLEAQLTTFADRRDALALQMIQLLEDAEFGGQQVNPQTANSLITQAQALLNDMHAALLSL